MLRRTARDFLTKESPSSFVRKVMETEDAYDPALWKKIAAQGWTALGIPEQYGGFGSFLDLVVVLEEMGRYLVPGPYYETMAMAVPTTPVTFESRTGRILRPRPLGAVRRPGREPGRRTGILSRRWPARCAVRTRTGWGRLGRWWRSPSGFDGHRRSPRA